MRVKLLPSTWQNEFVFKLTFKVSMFIIYIN